MYTEVFAGMEDSPFPSEAAVGTVTFEEHDGRTTVVSTWRYPLKEVRDLVIESGMEEGAAVSYDRLGELLGDGAAACALERNCRMSFQAYIDNIKAKTGKTPEEFRALAQRRGLLEPGAKSGRIVAWLREDFDLGRGHAMAIYATFKASAGKE